MKKSCRNMRGEGSRITQNENPEPAHINSLVEQSNVDGPNPNGNLNPKLATGTGFDTTQSCNNVNNSVEQQAEASSSNSETRGEDKGDAIAEPPPKTTKAEKGKGKAPVRLISEPSNRITAAAVSISKPWPSSSSDKGKAKVRGITISEPSKRITTTATASISKPWTRSSSDKGKAKVGGVTISEPSKSTAAAAAEAKKGKAKGVTISEAVRKRRNNVAGGRVRESSSAKAKVGATISSGPSKINAGTHGVGKGTRVENSGRSTITPDIPKSWETEQRIRLEAAFNDHPVHYIAWEGFNETIRESESVISSKACPICEYDLGSSGPWTEGDDDNEYGYYFRRTNPPDVGVLACGHTFHAQCLESITPEAQLADPPCILCWSISNC